MWWVAGGSLVFLALVLYVPFLRVLFHFSTLHPSDVALCVGAGAVSLGWFESLKVFGRFR
jgi:Ca2+-transporting ATPase